MRTNEAIKIAPESPKENLINEYSADGPISPLNYLVLGLRLADKGHHSRIAVHKQRLEHPQNIG
jgi:hypothetical protein